MKTLIWNGSPRKNGSTSFLVSELAKQLRGEVKIVETYQEKIEPCIDCRACWKQPGCIQNDAMQEFYSYIAACDNIVIASPLYYSELTGLLLSALSRLQVYYAARRFLKVNLLTKPKRGAVILCGGGDGSPQNAEETARCLLRQMNAKTISVISSLHTDDIESWEDFTAIEQIHELADLWNE